MQWLDTDSTVRSFKFLYGQINIVIRLLGQNAIKLRYWLSAQFD